jgi:hypothetical protein
MPVNLFLTVLRHPAPWLFKQPTNRWSMPVRIRFIGRYVNVGVFLLIGLLALIGFDQGGIGLPLLSAALIGAVALSVHATERMAFLESEEEWRKSEERAVELRRQFASLRPQVSEA